MKTSYDFEIFNIESHWISKENRFDASFYAKDVIAARVLIGELKEKGIPIKTIEKCSNKVYWPGRFKRKYVSKSQGNPFLTPSEIFMLVPESRKFVIDYPDNLSVKENWILITRSGTIGRCLITNRLIEKYVLSDDLIRIAPEDDSGYLYAYLQTWIGQTFLTKNKYGSTVKHIEPDHVKKIPIPDIPKIKNKLNKDIKKVFQLRLEAQELLIEADKMIYSKLKLPKISEDDVEYWSNDKDYRKIKAFDIKFSELNLRFDVSYHIPILRNIKNFLNDSKHPNSKLGKVIEDIFIPNRFKRPYVKNEDDGVPFLQGSHISQIKPMGIKYIWKRMTNIEKTKLEKNWILMTRSGTVGRIALVSELMDGWGASEHLLRLIMKENVCPGFITAFLSSDYGKYQIKGKVYGAVVDEIAEQDTSLIKDIDIILPHEDIQREIGDKVLEAYRKKDHANLLEDKAIKYLENKLSKLAAC